MNLNKIAAAVAVLAAALTGCGVAVTSAVPSTELELASEGKTNMPKTLVFNFDGTGNEPNDVHDFAKDGSISNIYKLYLLMGSGTPDVKTPGGGEQRAFYYKGIGTYGNKLRRIENEIFSPSREDAARILRDAHNDFQEYEKGDRVVVFGFSRGAALAREFVAKVLDDDVDDRRKIRIAFLGVFDTVVEEDGTKKRKAEYLGEDGTLDKRVQRAVHIVALDEDRKTFRTTLINKDASRPDRILEVWFPGAHTDIGGSHWHDGLSDQALAFMIDQCKVFVGDDIQISSGDWKAVNELLKELKESDPAQYKDIRADDIVIHSMVTGTLHVNRGLIAEAEDEFHGAVSRIVCVNDSDKCMPKEYPLVHYSAKERFDRVSEYRPAALRDVTFKLYQADGSHSETIHGINGLREAKKAVPHEGGEK